VPDFDTGLTQAVGIPSRLTGAKSQSPTQPIAYQSVVGGADATSSIFKSLNQTFPVPLTSRLNTVRQFGKVIIRLVIEKPTNKFR
jgi:hypothetical protein